MFNHILVVCVGNICRSPMVEYMLRNDSQLRKAGSTVSSAGLAALIGHPADSLAQELMLERGIDLSPHNARQLSFDLFTKSDLVLVMESWQQRKIEQRHPVARGRVTTLGRWQNVEIPDPYGKPREEFKEVLSLIEGCLKDWRQKLW